MNESSEDRPLALVPDPQYIQRLFPKCPPTTNKKQAKSNKQNKNNNKNNDRANNANQNPDQNSSQTKKTRKQRTRRQREAKRSLSKQNNDQNNNNPPSTTKIATNYDGINTLNDCQQQLNGIDNNNIIANNYKPTLTIRLNKVKRKLDINNNNLDLQEEDSSDGEKKSISGSGDVDHKLPQHRRFERHKSSSSSRRRRNSSANLLMPAISETQVEFDNTNNINNNNNNNNSNINNSDNSNITNENIQLINTKLDDIEIPSTQHDVGDDELICNEPRDTSNGGDDLEVINAHVDRETDRLVNGDDDDDEQVANDFDSRLSLVEVVQMGASDHDYDNTETCGQQNDNNNDVIEQQQQPRSTMFRQHKILNETSHFSLITPKEDTKGITSEQLVELVEDNSNIPVASTGFAAGDELVSIDTDIVNATTTSVLTEPEVVVQAEPIHGSNAPTATSPTETQNFSVSHDAIHDDIQIIMEMNTEPSLDKPTIRENDLINEDNNNNNQQSTATPTATIISDLKTNLSSTLMLDQQELPRTSSCLQFNTFSDDDLDSDNCATTVNTNQLASSVNAPRDKIPIGKVQVSFAMDSSDLVSARDMDHQNFSIVNRHNETTAQQSEQQQIDHQQQQAVISTNLLHNGNQQTTRPVGVNNNNSDRSLDFAGGAISPPTTIKTAFIFPRLDEGLSSNPDSGEEDVEEEDERAMDADVDADEDEYDEDDDDDEDEHDDDDDEDDVDDDDDDDDDEDADEDILPALERGNQALQQQLANQQQSSIDSLFRQQQQTKSIGANQSGTRSHLDLTPGGGGIASPFCNDNNQQQQQMRLNQQTKSTIGGYTSGSYSLDHHSELDGAPSELAKSLDTAYSNGSNNANYWPTNNQMSQQQQQHPSMQSGQSLPFSRLNNNSTGSQAATPGMVAPLNQNNGRPMTNTNSRNISHHKSPINNPVNRDEAKGANRFSSDTDNETDRLLGNQRNEQQQFYKQQQSNNNQNNNNMNQQANNMSTTNNNSLNMGNPSVDHANRNNQQHLTSGDLQLQPATNHSKSSNSREVLIEGVLFNVKYLGSTHSDCEGRSEKEDRIHQAEMAVHEVKYRNGDTQPAIEVQLFISTEKIMVLDDKNRKIMMDHSLRTISYIADIGNAIVLIVKKKAPSINSSSSAVNDNGLCQASATSDLQRPISTSANRIISKVSCHVFESQDSHTITKSISQAFQVAYTELLKANGTTDANNYMPKELDYQDVLNSQEMSTDELEMFARKENQREVIVPKLKGEILGLSIVESGWGSILPTVVIASLKQNLPAERCKKLSIGDQILSVNGISLVGLPLNECQMIIKRAKNLEVARLSVVPCPITVEVKIKRPDTKYQLGFSVQNGVICSLLRGGIAERGGVRVGHRIMSINGTTVVNVPHEKIVTLLASSVGEIRMKTCLTSLCRIILGEDKATHL